MHQSTRAPDYVFAFGIRIEAPIDANAETKPHQLWSLRSRFGVSLVALFKANPGIVECRRGRGQIYELAKAISPYFPYFFKPTV